MSRLIATQHYNPKPVDDSLSKSVYELFTKGLDGNKWLFVKEDIALFKKDEYSIDDYIRNNECDFITKYIDVVRSRVENSKTIVRSFLNTDLDYSGKDSVTFGEGGRLHYFKDQKDLMESWNRRIRFDVLAKIIEEDSVFESIPFRFEELEKEIKPKVIENQICLLEELINNEGGARSFVTETFLNALGNYQDPNTNFFNPTDKLMFENSVSSSQLTFGIYTEKDEDGAIVVTYITPGSAAYREGSIEESDIIKSMRSGKEVLETYCISNDDITDFLFSEKHHRITFKIRKKSGDIKSVTLTKADTKIDEHLIRGYVIGQSKDIGYINIPSFYTDLDVPNGLGLANDVANEIKKLNKEKVKGLIIDLRFNGGGSMKEAEELSGMFIDNGPVSIIRNRMNSTYTLRDDKKGTVFNRPIVIIVNSYSASASEFFAGAMQDYSRAIIVGTPTYGKSSSQVILPLSYTQNLGYCKITTDCFYRVTGKSHQSKGIEPDIHFPSMYEGLKIAEKYEDFALANDSINPTTKHVPLTMNMVKPVIERSIKRIEKSKDFTIIKDANAKFQSEYIVKDRKYPLNLVEVYKDKENYNTIWKQLENHFNVKTTTISARNTKDVNKSLKNNKEEQEVNLKTLEGIAEDIYVQEAYYILMDYLALNSLN
ncbi:MAG: carboxy terminal-processing peptidase [Bacteroidetes bacterium]|nr:carboxy terminal-processing peptidase [Bacteroidota bacterium]